MVLEFVLCEQFKFLHGTVHVLLDNFYDFTLPVEALYVNFNL